MGQAERGDQYRRSDEQQMPKDPLLRAVIAHNLTLDFISEAVVDHCQLGQAEETIFRDPFHFRDNFFVWFSPDGADIDRSISDRYLHLLSVYVYEVADKLGPYWFKARGDLLHNDNSPILQEVDLSDERVEVDILNYAQTRRGRADFVRDKHPKFIRAFKSMGFEDQDFWMADSFCKGMRDLFGFVAVVKDQPKTISKVNENKGEDVKVWVATRSRLELDLRFHSQRRLLDHFLDFKRRGVTTSDVLLLLEFTFEALGLRSYLDATGSDRLKAFYPGLYGEVFAACSLLDRGYALETYLKDTEDTLGVDFYINKPDGNRIAVQVKSSKDAKDALYMEINDEKDLEELRLRLIKIGIRQDKRRKYRDAMKELLEIKQEYNFIPALFVVPFRDLSEKTRSRERLEALFRETT